MEHVGTALDRKLAAWVAAAGLVLAAGCAAEPGPNDPTMTAEQESAMRERAYTEEQKQAREERPR